LSDTVKAFVVRRVSGFDAVDVHSEEWKTARPGPSCQSCSTSIPAYHSK